MSNLKTFAPRNIKFIYRLRGPSLLVQGGVSYDYSTDLYLTLNGDLTGVHYQDEIVDAFVHPYAYIVGLDIVLFD